MGLSWIVRPKVGGGIVGYFNGSVSVGTGAHHASFAMGGLLQCVVFTCCAPVLDLSLEKVVIEERHMAGICLLDPEG